MPKNPYAKQIKFALEVAEENPASYARKLNKTRSGVGAWTRENGTPPSLESMIKLSQDSGVSIDWMVTQQGPRTREAALTPLNSGLLIDAVGMIIKKLQETGQPEADALEIIKLAIPLYHYGLDTHSLDERMAMTLIETRGVA